MIIPQYNKNNGLSLVLLDIWNKTNEQRKRWASKNKKKGVLFLISKTKEASKSHSDSN